VGLELGYWQGNLAPSTAGPAERELIEGRALIGLRPVPWLMVAGGAHVRSYVTAAGTERWLFWQARLRAEPAIAGPRVRGRLEVWRAFAADVSTAPAFDRSYGGEVGLTLGPFGPLWLRMAYSIEDARFRGNTRRETVEELSFSVGAGRW
jgi:hypothetical protein